MWVCRSKLLAMENNNLALLCAASYGHESDDVNLENCFLYPRFFASFSSKEKPTVVIVSPSDIFIRKLLFDSAFRNVNFLIVINSKTKCKIYHQYLNDTTYFGSGEIKFYTFEEFCSNQKTTIDSVLLFATRIADTDQENLICALAEICDSNTQIYSFHESDEFEKASGYISKYIASGKVLLQEIDILPLNLLFAKGKKKKISCKWNIVNESLQDPSDYPVCLNKYNLICDDFQFLSKFSLELFTNKRAIWEEGNSIRKAYRNLMYTNKSGQTRMPAKKYRFSPEISVFYTVDNFKSDGSFRLRCHLKKHSLTKRTGIVIEESKRNYRHILPFLIPDIIENDYLFSTKNRTLIRDIYKDNFYDFANAEKLSLRSFFYLFFPWSEWKEDDNKNFELVKNILNTELGEFDIVSSSAKKYEEAYYDFELMNMNIEFEEYIEILREITRYAVKQSVCEKDIWIDFVPDTEYSKNKAYNIAQCIKDKMANRFLTKRQLNKIYNYALKEVNFGKVEYLSVLIKMFTGMKNRTISELFWIDFKYNYEHDFYTLTPALAKSKYLANETIPYSIPCIKKLSNILVEVREQLRKTYSDSEIDMLPIIPNRKSKANIYESCKPEDIQKLCKKSLGILNFDDYLIENDDEDFLLKVYQGDFIRESFHRILIHQNKLTDNEIAVILGLKPKMTYSRHYADYLEEDSLKRIYTKLSEIETLID